MFLILAERDGYVLPIFYCLLPGKSGDVYKQLFNIIKDIWPDLAPERISCDFELAIVNAARESWPTASIDGCFFHFKQNLSRKIASIGYFYYSD